MSRYRPIDVRLWSDRGFLSLSDDGKMLWIFLLTTPSTLAIPGVIIGGEATLAEQLDWPLERYRKGFTELQNKRLRVRVEGRVVWLSNALKYQPPTSPNMIKGWTKCWDEIPDGDLKDSIWEALRIACKRWHHLFTKGFPKVWGKGYAQPSLELYPSGSGSGSGSETRSGSGSGSGSVSEGDTHETPKLSVVRDDRSYEVERIVREIFPEHLKLYNEIRSEFRIEVPPMAAIGAPAERELRDLLHAMPSLVGALERCRHALRVRAAQTRKTQPTSLQYFGVTVWKQIPFDRAQDMQLDDATRQGPVAARSAFDTVDEFFDELAKEPRT